MFLLILLWAKQYLLTVNEIYRYRTNLEWKNYVLLTKHHNVLRPIRCTSGSIFTESVSICMLLLYYKYFLGCSVRITVFFKFLLSTTLKVHILYFPFLFVFRLRCSWQTNCGYSRLIFKVESHFYVINSANRFLHSIKSSMYL